MGIGDHEVRHRLPNHEGADRRLDGAAPSTVLLGVFGTSIEDADLYSKTGVWAMLTLIFVVSGSILLVFRRRGWI